MTKEVSKYLLGMQSGARLQCNLTNSLYAARKGHLRLAREIGYALNDFSEKEQKDIIHGSYGMVYVIACNLKPILSAKEWINEIVKGQSK